MSNIKKPKRQPTGDYPVGYAKPPARTKWRKGQSGNPEGSKGRKRKAPTKDELRDDFLEIMESLVLVKINGEERTMKAKKAIIYQIVAKAVSGDHRSQKLVLEKLEGSISLEEAIKEAQESQLPKKIQVRFVQSDGNGGLSEFDQDLKPDYKGPPPKLIEVKPGELRAAKIEKAEAASTDAPGDDFSWLDE
ncbi:MAG: DUF5681 domain-containing protein [Parvularculaceae bacterium]